MSDQIDPNRLQRALNHAMGFACPDSTGCGNLFPGFYYQLFGNVDTDGNRYLGATKSLMKSFSAPAGRGPDLNGAPAKVGDSVSIENTIGDYIGILKQQLVTLGNRATAALYRYTPHVFNGNYNFWKFFISWFKYPNGTLLTSSQDGTTFIIQNGLKQPVPSFVAVLRGLKLSSAIIASPTELDNYSLGGTYAPVDNTVAKVDGTFFVFIDGIPHPASSFVLAQRKVDTTKSLTLLSNDLRVFPQGQQLTPNNGTVVRGAEDIDVYLVSGGVLKLFSPFTFRQFQVAKQVQIIPDSEIAIYPKQGFVIPREGTLIRAPSGSDAYVINQERRLPLTPELFKNLGYKAKDVVRLTTNAEIASIPLGPPAPPREGTFFSITGSPELYEFKNGAKHPISAFVAAQRGIKPDYAFDASIISNWPDGIVIPPLDGTVLKNESSSTLYLVSQGQLHVLTAVLFKNLGFSHKNVVTLPDAEVEALPTDGFALPRENSYFANADTHEVFVFKHGTKHQIYPLVVAQRGMTPDFSFPTDMVAAWPTGTPIPPRDGTLVQGDASSTRFIMERGTLHAVSKTVFRRHGFRVKQIQILPEAEIETFVQADPLAR